ncbi:nuclease [Roseibium sp. TrichSKD4]|uniref:thermonuclease family protein n=1 Tax=Roseibium sp. TrichSKD4 TaxID=744980 RepID=UPI0001E57225|nr:thermonuclease family protein [Roseibium sp. TrichSKD4]EFO28787.1 nuclease [Roseibium sp. TrichSKD4]
MPSHIAVAILMCVSVCEPETLRIWDGDSFLIGRHSGAEKIRIENIDTPEIDGHCRYERQLALEAKHRVAELVKHQKIQIVRSGRDKYGRTLARVLANGKDIGRQLVADGLARPWSGKRRPWC